MTVGIDIVTEAIRTDTSAPTTFSHAAAASGVKGVVLILIRNGTASAMLNYPTYGGVVLNKISEPFDTAGEAGTVSVFFLGAGVPQGTQTVSYNVGTTTDDVQAVCITLTGAKNLSVVDYDSLGENRADPSLSFTTGGKSCMAFIGLFSGLAAVGDITDGAGLTRLHDHDFGQTVSVVARQTTASTADFTASFTAASDDCAIAGICVSDSELTQVAWRVRADDGSESAATWLQSANTDHTFNGVTADTPVRIRFGISSLTEYINVQPALEAAIQAANLNDITTCSYYGDPAYINVGAQESVVGAIFFKDNGLSLYVVGYDKSIVYQYTLSVAWDVSTATYASKSLNASSKDGSMVGLVLSSDGASLFVLGLDTDTVYQYTLSTPWDVSTGTFSKSYSFGASSDPKGMTFSPDGSKCYLCTALLVKQYTLSTPWQVDTMSDSGNSLNTNAQSASAVMSVALSADGKTLFALKDTTTYQYTLATAWDVSTATYASKSFAHSPGPRTLFIRPSGTAAYFSVIDSGLGVSVIYQYTMGDLWFLVTTSSTKVKAVDSTNLTHAADTTPQISGASVGSLSVTKYSGKVFESLITQCDSPRSLAFSADGTKMYALNSNNTTIYQYALSTAWDVSTASYASKSFTVTSGGQQIFFSADGTRVYCANYDVTRIYQHTLSTAWDISTAGSGTSLLVSGQMTQIRGAAISTDGTKVYAAAGNNSTIYQYTLSTAWDITTGSYANKSLDLSNDISGTVWNVCLSPDGSAMYVLDASFDTIYQYALSTAWDVSTGGSATQELTLTTEDTSPYGFAFGAGMMRMFMVGRQNYDVFQYNSTNFIWPNSGVSETGTAGTDNDMDFTASSKSEVEYAVSLVKNDLFSGAKVLLRVRSLQAYAVPMAAGVTVNMPVSSLMLPPPGHWANHILVR